MNNSPLVSILIPVYSVEKYIERCARSIFEQTYDNLEYIFVDDCTPDNSIAILEKVIKDYPERKKNVRIIHHPKNRGIAATRNTAVDACKGTFLFFVDSDDWLEKNAIDLLVERQQETDADVVTASFYRHSIIGGNEIIEESLVPEKEQDRMQTLKVMLEYGSVVALWNRLIRRSLYREHNIKCVEGVDAGEDLMVTPRLIYHSQKVASCNSITYHYNQTNPNSYVNVYSSSWEMQLQLIRATLLNVDFFNDKEEFLCEAMNKQLVERLKMILELNFRNNNHHGYNRVLAMLDDTNRKYWPLIGWNRQLKRWIDHHYIISRITFPLRKMRGEILLSNKKSLLNRQ